MTPERRAKLKAAGYSMTTPADAIGLREIERKVVAFRSELAREVRRLRGEKGLSQEDLAAIIQISQSRMPAIERGEKVSIESILMAHIAAGGELPTVGPLELEPSEVSPDAIRKIDASGEGRLGNEMVGPSESRKAPRTASRARLHARRDAPDRAKQLPTADAEKPDQVETPS